MWPTDPNALSLPLFDSVSWVARRPKTTLESYLNDVPLGRQDPFHHRLYHYHLLNP
jgi:hypothetical protein